METGEIPEGSSTARLGVRVAFSFLFFNWEIHFFAISTDARGEDEMKAREIPLLLSSSPPLSLSLSLSLSSVDLYVISTRSVLFARNFRNEKSVAFEEEERRRERKREKERKKKKKKRAAQLRKQTVIPTDCTNATRSGLGSEFLRG